MKDSVTLYLLPQIYRWVEKVVKGRIDGAISDYFYDALANATNFQLSHHTIFFSLVLIVI